MLGDKDAIGTLAVKDLAVAKKFYQGTLGLKLEDETGTEAHTYRSGGARPHRLPLGVRGDEQGHRAQLRRRRRDRQAGDRACATAASRSNTTTGCRT